LLCGNSSEVYDLLRKRNKGKKVENFREYDLISPCLCSIKMHRECLKSLILTRRIAKCPRCNEAYSIGKKTSKEKVTGLKKHLFTLLYAIFYLVVSFGCALGVMDSVNKLRDPHSSVGPLRLALALALCSIIIGATIMYIMYIWRSYCSDNLIDIEIFCKQNEGDIVFDFPEITLERFLRKEDLKPQARIMAREKILFDLLNIARFDEFCKRPLEIEMNERIRARAQNAQDRQTGDNGPHSIHVSGSEVLKYFFNIELLGRRICTNYGRSERSFRRRWR